MSLRARSRTPFTGRRPACAGGALVATLAALLVLSGLAALIFTLGYSHSREVARAGQELRALYLAEAGLGEALGAVAQAIENSEPAPERLGSAEQPLASRGGSFWASIVDNGDDTYTVVSSGTTNGSTRSVEGVLRRVGEGVFHHAIFAGNRSGNPGYALRLGGRGTQADQVTGDVFSAGNIEVSGDAHVAGQALATGTVTGMSGAENVTRPLPDIAGMHYDSDNDVDVAAAFAARGVAGSSVLGGTAIQVPESDPAHIFRKNPGNRLTEINGTAKDDYFLEDPYMPVKDFTAYNGQPGHTITLAGAPGKPGADANGLLYYIDGNLWVHNTMFLRLRFASQDATGTRLTFVVRGNVYFCDDVLLEDQNRDGVAFIAIRDEAVRDSGNIYFGDPRFGTLERMQAYMYAENNFYDNNLAADGSKVVELFGNMTAGNHVSILRDFQRADGSVAHSKLSVRFDDRVARKHLELPRLPRLQRGSGSFEIAFWREVGTP